MEMKGFNLAWIVVNDFKKAIQFYTEVMGLKVQNCNDEHGWAELTGPNGALLGIAKVCEHTDVKPGSNAVPTFSVVDIVAARASLEKKGTKLLGEIIEVPGQVKLQTCVDQDGNHFQLCQCLEGAHC